VVKILFFEKIDNRSEKIDLTLSLIFVVDFEFEIVFPSLLGISYEVGLSLSEAKTIVLEFDFALDF
jgi:hypothetical protein